MKRYNCKYISEGHEYRCQLLANSLDDAKDQFKRFTYTKGSILTFIECDEQETERTAMLKSISAVIRQKQFSLN